MAEILTLCDYCQGVELDPEFLCNISFKQWTLGTGARISASSCPLCAIIRHVYYENQRLRIIPRHLRLDHQVFLKWVNSDLVETGGRPGFQVGGEGADGLQLDWIDGIWICLQRTQGSIGPVHQICCLKTDIPVQLDTQMITEWIRLCTLEHGETCSLEIDRRQLVGHKFPGLKVFRLVDVELRRIVQFKEDEMVPPYVALSYVWGSANSIQLTTANIPALTTVAGFETAHSLLPRTICDTITLVQSLRMRFLWIDTLCLLQNDSRDVSSGVSVMDCIYEASYLTVVAAEGYNAHSGLPGVQPESRMRHENFKVKPGLFLGLDIRLDWLLERSVYRSRGWT